MRSSGGAAFRRNAEAPAAKVKRGEKQNAPKQAKKAVKAGEEEGETDEPGEGVEPTPDDVQVFELLRLAHEARGIPLVDVVLVDGRRWCSMAAR